MSRYSTEFYHLETRLLAQKLLGAKLVRVLDGVRMEGIIVETEAYLHKNDPACHAARGMTRRNQTMFASPGHLYVYTIHTRQCMNVVTEREGLGAAVLIRALEPCGGFELMEANRNRVPKKHPLRKEDWANGPGKLCEAFGIGLPQNGIYLPTDDDIWIEPGPEIPRKQIGKSGRIGISQGTNLLYRYFINGNRFVS